MSDFSAWAWVEGGGKLGGSHERSENWGGVGGEGSRKPMKNQSLRPKEKATETLPKDGTWGDSKEEAVEGSVRVRGARICKKKISGDSRVYFF